MKKARNEFCRSLQNNKTKNVENKETEQNAEKCTLGEYLFEVLSTAGQLVPCGLRKSDLNKFGIINPEMEKIMIDKSQCDNFKSNWKKLKDAKIEEYMKCPED